MGAAAAVAAALVPTHTAPANGTKIMAIAERRMCRLSASALAVLAGRFHATSERDLDIFRPGGGGLVTSTSHPSSGFWHGPTMHDMTRSFNMLVQVGSVASGRLHAE